MQCHNYDNRMYSKYNCIARPNSINMAMFSIERIMPEKTQCKTTRFRQLADFTCSDLVRSDKIQPTNQPNKRPTIHFACILPYWFSFVRLLFYKFADCLHCLCTIVFFFPFSSTYNPVLSQYYHHCYCVLTVDK